MILEYEKMNSNNISIDNLQVHNSKYDGILLGAMPHKVKGRMKEANSLIDVMLSNPENYPPFVVARTQAGKLEFNFSSFKRAIQELSEKLDKKDRYETE